MSDYGLIEAHPHDVTDHRTRIDATNIKIIAEVDSMRYTWLGQAKPTAHVAAAARRVRADAACVGHPDETTMLNMIHSIQTDVPGLPVVLAGYTNHENGPGPSARRQRVRRRG